MTRLSQAMRLQLLAEASRTLSGVPNRTRSAKHPDAEGKGFNSVLVHDRGSA